MSSSQGCYNKVPQSRWEKTTEIYHLTVLEAKVQNQGVSSATLPPDSGKNPSLPILESGVANNLQNSTPPLQSLPLLSQGLLPVCPVFTWPSLFLLGHQSYWIKDHTDDLIFTHLYLQRPYFQIRSHPQVPGVRTWAELFWRTQFSP